MPEGGWNVHQLGSEKLTAPEGWLSGAGIGCWMLIYRDMDNQLVKDTITRITHLYLGMRKDMQGI